MKDKKKEKTKRNQAWQINNENTLELGEALVREFERH
jgi:hypothetical protein